MNILPQLVTAVNLIVLRPVMTIQWTCNIIAFAMLVIQLTYYAPVLGWPMAVALACCFVGGVASAMLIMSVPAAQRERRAVAAAFEIKHQTGLWPWETK